MNTSKIDLIKLCLLFFCVSCGHSSVNKSDTKQVDTKNASISAYEMPNVPSMITTPEAREQFIAEQYWGKYNFSDTTLISRENITEQAFADFIYLLANMNVEMAKKGMITMMSKAEANKDMYNHFMELCEKYLYDPNSPMRNESLYVAALESILSNDKLEEIEKIRPKFQYDLALKNRVGDKAANFSYTTPNDKESKLYDIKSDYILIFFYNPDCPNCTEVRQYITESAILNDNRVNVLAMYADNELELWRDYQSNIPNNWISGYDKHKTIDQNNIYDLRASPTLYLISKDKSVLLKDADIKTIELYLEEN